MFCNNCGAQFSESYCRSCGVSAPKDVSKYKAVFEVPKFCMTCGGEFKDAYCATCGRSGGAPKITPAKKLTAPWQLVPKETPASGSANNSTAPSGAPAAASPLADFQLLRYGITAIFVLALFAAMIPPPVFWNMIFRGAGSSVLKILMLLVFSAGVIVPPFVIKENAQSQAFVYGAAAGLTLLLGITALATHAIPLLGFILILPPVAMLAYHSLSYWNSFSLPPELTRILHTFSGIKLVWLFCMCFVFSSSNFISTAIIVGLVSASAYLLEKGDQSKFKLAIGLLIAGCALQFVFALFSPFSRVIVCLLGLVQLGIAIYIGKDILTDSTGSFGSSTAQTGGQTRAQAPQYSAQSAYQGQAQYQGQQQPPPPPQPQYQAQQPYHGQPVYQTQSAAFPLGQLKTNRGLLRFILFSIITFGIYPIVFYSAASDDINTIAGRYDGRKTMHYCLLLFLVGPLTLGIAYFVWFHNIYDRIGNELRRRGIYYSFGASTFWLWDILGSLILIGPFVALYKFSAALNKIAQDYNVRG